MSRDRPPIDYGIHGKLFAPDGTLVGAEFHANTIQSVNVDPAVAAHGGQFAVFWTGFGPLNAPVNSIQGRRYLTQLLPPATTVPSVPVPLAVAAALSLLVLSRRARRLVV